MPISDRFPGATLHLGQGRSPRPCHIRLHGSLATIGAPAILLEDSRPQPILKFHRPSSLEPANGLLSFLIFLTEIDLYTIAENKIFNILQACEPEVVLAFPNSSMIKDKFKTVKVLSDLYEQQLFGVVDWAKQIPGTVLSNVNTSAVYTSSTRIV